MWCSVLPPEIVMHDDAYICGRSEINIKIASCMTISGGRTKQLDIFCCVTGFASDFLSVIVVKIRFFHRALQFFVSFSRLGSHWKEPRSLKVLEFRLVSALKCYGVVWFKMSVKKNGVECNMYLCSYFILHVVAYILIACYLLSPVTWVCDDFCASLFHDPPKNV